MLGRLGMGIGHRAAIDAQYELVSTRPPVKQKRHGKSAWRELLASLTSARGRGVNRKERWWFEVHFRQVHCGAGRERRLSKSWSRALHAG